MAARVCRRERVLVNGRKGKLITIAMTKKAWDSE